MANDSYDRKKRKSTVERDDQPKRHRDSIETPVNENAGKVLKVFVRNFMCHDALEVALNKNVNFIIGRNGSGKSAILTALTVGLGARANVTSRGTSVKEFIKKGKQTATIEITLSNVGPMAYKPDIYGDAITIHRSIGSVSSYKIKNWKGEVISKKRDELDNILCSLNIQINNPVSILNQDVSRTFLVTSKPDEKYNLFMKATQLDEIGNNYREAKASCKQALQKLNDTNEVLQNTRNAVKQLEEKIKSCEQVDKFKEEVEQLQIEYQWAIAIEEEKRLEKADEHKRMCEDSLKHYEDLETSLGSGDDIMQEKIRQLESKIEEAHQEVSSSNDLYRNSKERYTSAKEAHTTKFRELKGSQNKIKRLQDNIMLLHREIQKLESGDGEQNEQNDMKKRLTVIEQKLDEVEAILRTKQTDQMHLEANKMQLSRQAHSTKIEIENAEIRARKLQQQINALKQQSDNATTVFGPNIPRFLRRIEEEDKRGRFSHKPRGPIGAYMKMKDPAWAPAVENFLGFGTLSAFCVNNTKDAKILGEIVKEIFMNDRPPQIICSKFFNKVHDVRRYSTHSPTYSNLLEAMDISDPVVTNCLIDQREIECILLIPTSAEAAEMMSNSSVVPRNCKRAFTQKGDIFFPDPHYRSYGGRRGLRARLLQVSTAEAIRGLEEELRGVENETQAARNTLTGIREKTQRANSELAETSQRVHKLRSDHVQFQSEIADLKDKIELNEGLSVSVFRTELVELEEKLQQEKDNEKRLAEETTELHEKLDKLEEEVKRYKNLQTGIDEKVQPWRQEIKKLKDEKDLRRLKGQHMIRKLQSAKQELQNATAEYDVQLRVSEKAVADASKYGERIDNQRNPNEVKNLLMSLKEKIHHIESRIGSKEQLIATLNKKKEKFGNVFDFATVLENASNNHAERLQNRCDMFKSMKKSISSRIQKSFATVLALRNYKGGIKIDHMHKVLDLEVNPHCDVERLSKDTRTLSGGERSYSTVAFLLALWDCTGLPFYFLDEFDVFMDKVNRRIILDLLLHHTREHPESQFVFLTPLDTSHITAGDFITIHQLAPPDRAGDNQ